MRSFPSISQFSNKFIIEAWVPAGFFSRANWPLLPFLSRSFPFLYFPSLLPLHVVLSSLPSGPLKSRRGFGEGNIADYSENQLLLPSLPCPFLFPPFPHFIPLPYSPFPSLPFPLSIPLLFPSLSFMDTLSSRLLIYLPRKDERLSRPGWLTYSGRFTHISGHRQLQVERRTGKVRRSSSPIKDRRSTTVYCYKYRNKQPANKKNQQQQIGVRRW